MNSKTHGIRKLKRSAPVSHSARSEFEQLAEASTDAIRVINRDFSIHYINRIFSEMTGVAQNNIAGRKCWEVFPSPLCHTSSCRLQRILKGEQTIQVEIERIKKDGTIIPCMVTASPMTGETGKLTGIIEQFRDITAHRQMKKQVEETEDRYRALIELGTEAGEAIIMLQDIDGKEGIQTFFNDQWPKITGYSKQELLNISFFELIHPANRQASIERHRQKMAGKTVPGLYEMRLIRKDGDEIFVELTGAYTNSQGKRANVMFIRDVTGRKQTEIKLALSEKQFQTLFENSPVNLWEMDVSYLKRFIDKICAQGVRDLKEYFLGHPEDAIDCMINDITIRINRFTEKMMGMSIDDMQDKAYIRRNLKRNIDDYLGMFIDFAVSISQGKTKLSREFPIRTSQGQIKYILQQISVVPGYEDTWRRVISADIEITERKKMENELKKYQNHLEEIIKERTCDLEQSVQREQALRSELEEKMQQRVDFNRMLVHELKTPLMPLLVTSSILLNEIKDEPHHSMMENVNRGAVSLSRRVNELLDMEKAEAGMLSVIMEEVDILSLLHHVFALVAPQAKEKEQIFTADLPSVLPPVMGDYERLQQILLNLIGNAFKYTPYSGRIILKAGTDTKNIIIEVKDNGHGISKEKQQKLFQPYYLDEAGSHLSGFGIGLALCKRLIELQNGKIWVDSTTGNGSTFSFSLPAIKV
jgi:PAS domain S-box-containing protein